MEQYVGKRMEALLPLGDVRRNWREEYNCEPPHSSLGYRTPAEIRQALGSQKWKPLRASPSTQPRRRRNHLNAKRKPENRTCEWRKFRGRSGFYRTWLRATS